MSQPHTQVLVGQITELFPELKPRLTQEEDAEGNPQWYVSVTSHEKQVVLQAILTSVTTGPRLRWGAAIIHPENIPEVEWQWFSELKEVLAFLGKYLRTPRRYVFRDTRPRYIVIDPRAVDPECGHNLSEESAYEDLANHLIYQKQSEKGIYPNYDDDAEIERNDKLVKRLGRWLMKRDGK